MNYSNDCGCAAPAAPKLVKTHSVAPAAATEEIVCPDARCLPHLLNSLPETDDAVPNYVGVYKGQSYIAPIRALVDSVLMDSLNSMYRDGKVPTVVNYRDIESVPVIQKENCQKVAVTSMPTLAKAMTSALPAAPAGYEPVKVMTTDKEGDVYLASALQVVSPALIPAIIDNCEKGKIVNVPVIDRILGFGKGCKEFGSTTLKQLQEALSKVVPIAAIKTLPDTLRGYKAGEELQYPISLNSVRSFDFVTSYGGTQKPATPGAPIAFGSVAGPLVPEGLWVVSVAHNLSIAVVTPAVDFTVVSLGTNLGEAKSTITTFPKYTSAQLSTNLTGNSTSISKTIRGPLQLKGLVTVYPGSATEIALNGTVTYTLQEVSSTAIVVNGVI